MEDPAADASTTAKITLIVQHADEMATAYQALYGKDWTTDAAYGADTLNAGYLFLKKLAKNEPLPGEGLLEEPRVLTREVGERGADHLPQKLGGAPGFAKQTHEGVDLRAFLLRVVVLAPDEELPAGPGRGRRATSRSRRAART